MTPDKIISVARAEIGTREIPANSNNVKYNTWYYGHEVRGAAFPWCAAFVAWVFNNAGAPELLYGGKKTAYCPTLKAYHSAQAVTEYKPGDIIFFNFSGRKTAAHVGICESVTATQITTIDGNTGTGNEANGGAVMRRTRSLKYVVGGFRPAYDGTITMTEAKTVNITLPVVKIGSKGTSVKALQMLLTANGFPCGTADGVCGAKTVEAIRKYQMWKKLAVDGVCGAATWNALLND